MLCELLEGSFGHVAFLLIGIYDCELEVISVIAEVGVDLDHLPVGGYRLVAPTSQVEDVATTVTRIGMGGTHSRVAVIRCQRGVEIAPACEQLGLHVQEILILWIHREPLPDHLERFFPSSASRQGARQLRSNCTLAGELRK